MMSSMDADLNFADGRGAFRYSILLLLLCVRERLLRRGARGAEASPDSPAN